MSVDLKQRSIIENDIPTPEMRVQTWCNSCTKFETEHSSQLQTRIPPPWQNSMSGWDFGTSCRQKSHHQNSGWDFGTSCRHESHHPGKTQCQGGILARYWSQNPKSHNQNSGWNFGTIRRHDSYCQNLHFTLHSSALPST